MTTPHVCTCGDCSPIPYADRCQFEGELRFCDRCAPAMARAWGLGHKFPALCAECAMRLHAEFLKMAGPAPALAPRSLDIDALHSIGMGPFPGAGTGDARTTSERERPEGSKT